MSAATLSPATDPAAVQRLIDRFAELSTTPADQGVTRLGYSALEREAHAVFAAHMESLGLPVRTDAAGNSFASLAGTGNLPALATGSHLDSVPRGGRYDGVAGVVAAMLAATALSSRAEPPSHPMEFVVFANEEGARFGQACNGSRALAARIGRDDLDRLHDADHVTLAQAMAEVGLDPDRIDEARLDPADWAAFLELHIEQGNILAERGIQLGVVDTISGSTRFRLVVHGVPSHSGGTPMNRRVDALVVASRIVLAARTLATDARHHGTRITVGRMVVGPNSMTTIPGRVELAVDVRDTDPARQRDAANELVSEATGIAEQEGAHLDAELISDASPTVLPARVTAASQAAIAELGYSHIVMASGASHDTQLMNLICPAGMIFVPSGNGGVSHAPREWTAAPDIARGVDALIATLLRLDRAPSPDGGAA